MGKFIQGFIAAMCIMILCTFVAHKTKMCNISFGPGDQEEIVCDSSQTETTPVNILEKQYSIVNIDEMLLDHQELIVDVRYVDSFRELPVATIQNVANMLLRSRQYITIPNVVDEYIANKNIYDNIQPNAVIDPGAKKENEITNPDTTAKSTNELQDPNPVAAQNRSEENKLQSLSSIQK